MIYAGCFFCSFLFFTWNPIEQNVTEEKHLKARLNQHLPLPTSPSNPQDVSIHRAARLGRLGELAGILYSSICNFSGGRRDPLDNHLFRCIINCNQKRSSYNSQTGFIVNWNLLNMCEKAATSWCKVSHNNLVIKTASFRYLLSLQHHTWKMCFWQMSKWHFSLYIHICLSLVA